MEIKKFIIYSIWIFIIFSTVNLIASEESNPQSHKDKTNVTFSPFAYNHFTGSISGINDDYGFREQFLDVPAKRVGIEKLFKLSSWNAYAGHMVQLSHNRINTGINPYEGPDYEKKGTSIVDLSFGLTGMQAISFISEQLYFKLTAGFSYIHFRREEVNDNDTILGKYIDVGLRYVFSSETKYNINVGIDFSYGDSWLRLTGSTYQGIGLRGIYPYVGIMW
jgi:hypothetical protein